MLNIYFIVLTEYFFDMNRGAFDYSGNTFKTAVRGFDRLSGIKLEEKQTLNL